MKYTLYHLTNEEAIIEVNSVMELQLTVRDFFEAAMTIVDDDDERLKDDFLYCSKSRVEAVEDMDVKQLKEVVEDEFGWSIRVKGDTEHENKI